MTDDSADHIPRHVLLPAYEATARRRYLRRFSHELDLWLDDQGPQPEAHLAGEEPKE